MFFATMVNDVIANIKKTNQVERQQSSLEANIKPCKRQSKKSRVKNCFHGDEFEEKPDTPFRRGNNSKEHQKPNNKTTTATKVKSASWKRSENAAASFNTLTNKKHKKSSNWLRFPNNKMKKSDIQQSYNRSESLSACRPGTTYSDVLFGAGCSNLVKIKNCITPRFYSSNQSTNVAQKKLTKSLFKIIGNSDNKICDENETEEKKSLFPALQTIKNKLFPASLKISSNNNNNIEKTQVPSNIPPTSAPNETNAAEAFILPGMENLSLNENKTCCDNFLEHLDNNLHTTAATFVNDNKKYLFDSVTKIPKWNFTCVETGASDGFPKFLYQFEDENYLKAEKMALLGLKLAAGNSIPNKK